MKLNRKIDPARASARGHAFTMTEMMVSMATGSLILGAVAAFFMYGNQSFVAISNYMDLNRASCAALDRMTKDIRESIELRTYTTNLLLFRTVDAAGSGSFTTNWLIFSWDPYSRRLVRVKFGAGVPLESRVLLTECDYLCFKVYQRNPIPGRFDFYPATNLVGEYQPDLGKLVDVSWRCSRTIKGTKLQTESVQTAKICMRN